MGKKEKVLDIFIYGDRSETGLNWTLRREWEVEDKCSKFSEKDLLCLK